MRAYFADISFSLRLASNDKHYLLTPSPHCIPVGGISQELDH